MNKKQNKAKLQMKRPATAFRLRRWLGGVFVLPNIAIAKLCWDGFKKREIKAMIKDIPLIVPIMLWLFIFVLMLSLVGRIYLWLS